MAKKNNNLKGLLASCITLIGVIIGLFFLSPNLTGNAISNLSATTSSWIGAIIVIAALLAGFFLMWKK